MNSHDSVSVNGETQVLAVILDLDGTLLDTESATRGILQEFLAKYGIQVDKEREANKRIGMTLKDSAASIVKDYDLQLTPDQFINEIMPIYHEKWKQVGPLPGANRLIRHLYEQGVPFALASNSLQEYIDAKISVQEGWKECFSVIVGSDQVKSGKPSPDIFIEAAKRLGIDAVHCLVIEDSMVGVKAAKSAKMKVVAIPSQKEADCSTLADSVLNSLLEFQPELWDLPEFDDWIENALPIEPIYMNTLYRNDSVHELTEDAASSLPDQVSGVYFGWAVASALETFKVVVGIGWHLRSYTATRKIQICIIDGDCNHASDLEMELTLVGFIRGLNSTEITSVAVEIREEDKSIASASLDLPMFIHHSCMASRL
ncbi:hypothetical protein HS088_TW18G00073 [Tripterygium wilfordii]|uniref:Riboflavin kinase n=1 Tax=Tripterygium wilfordii TaxID=458696 RepID=A0A7J7CCD4_TRIWF|nr:hypothetical protein HS088_TW18G00073 [Tripterygium wilfordii]